MRLAEARGEFEYSPEATNTQLELEGATGTTLIAANGVNPFVTAATSNLISHVKEVSDLQSVALSLPSHETIIKYLVTGNNW